MAITLNELYKRWDDWSPFEMLDIYDENLGFLESGLAWQLTSKYGKRKVASFGRTYYYGCDESALTVTLYN